MKLGAENKKQVYILIGLLVVAAYFVYSNVLSGPSAVPAPSTASETASTAGTPAAAPSAPAQEKSVRAPSSRTRSEEFHPVWMAKRPEDRPDPTKIDPAIHWDLFAKVQGVPPAGGSRNLFQFTQAPPKETVKLAGAEPTVHPFVPYGPKAPAPPAPPPPPPPPPPIPLKFYGYSTTTAAGKRQGYFMDGEEILLAGEGDTLKRRYKIVRIGPNAALIEDLDAKRQQSVPLAEEGQG